LKTVRKKKLYGFFVKYVALAIPSLIKFVTLQFKSPKMAENRIFPIVVIYKIQLADSTAYQKFLSCLTLDAFMVYDNSPEDFLQNMSLMPANAVYVRDKENGGLSVAYNRAAVYAREHGYDKLLLLDEDTAFPVEMFRQMQACSAAVCVPRILLKNGSCFSPSCWRGGRVRGVDLQPGEHPLSRYLLINSGLCVSLDAFFRAGGYNEKVRLDFADFQFVIRLRRVEQSFTLLDCEARQDFSNEKTCHAQLHARFLKYLDGARNLEECTLAERLKIAWLVCLHTLALTKRTRRADYIRSFLSSFWTHGKY